jgi:lipoyl(octanoyl) transferase
MILRLRIINDGPRDAAFNMAADRYLLEQAANHPAVFLRLYSWSPPAISLGCMQRPGAILDNEAMTENNVDGVMRPTGGRAVLHWNDLTYAFIFPANEEELGRTISQSYSVVSRCLMRGFTLAGIPCGSHDSAAEYAATRREIKLPCFLSPNRGEIMAAGKKLVGSAQKRTAAAVLQHGSIPLDASFRRLPEFLTLSQNERTRQGLLLGIKCVCVKEINPALDFEKLSACLIKGFTETLRCPSIEKPWDDEELKEIHAIM